MREKMNVRKLFRMTAFIRRRRSLCSHENRLWSGEKRFDRSQKWQDEFETRSGNLTAMEAQSSTGLPTVKTASVSCVGLRIIPGRRSVALRASKKSRSLPMLRTCTVLPAEPRS